MAKYTIITIGSLFTIVLLISAQLFYANAVPSYWNILFVIYWFLYIGAMKILQRNEKMKWKKVQKYMIVIGLVISIWFLIALPRFSYHQAVEALCEDIIECEESQLIDTHAYQGWILDDTQCKVMHKDYLIVFDGSPISAFWFDPYTGDYGEIDIGKEFPFLAEKLTQKTSL